MISAGPFIGTSVGVLIFLILPVLGSGGQVPEATQLVNLIDQYDRLPEFPQASHFKVYFFEIQNPDEVHTGEQYPAVKEKGPYVYRQSKWKSNIIYSDDNRTASFDVYRKYEFDQEASGDLRDTDEIYILNPMMNSIFQQLEMDEIRKHLLSIVGSTIIKVFNGATNFFLKTTPREVLFTGIEFCINPTSTGAVFCDTVEDHLLENIEKTQNGLSYALFRHYATKSEGHFEVDIATLIVEKFNGDDKLHTWLNDKDEDDQEIIPSTCNKLYGSFDNFVPPFPNKADPLSSLQTNICRVISKYYAGEAKYKGISGMEYRTGKDFVEEIGPEFGNECFCVNITQGVNQTQDNGCLFQGALDLFSCLHEPTIMTKPHMLDADEMYTTNIIGLDPDNAKHGTLMIIEPYTGTVLQRSKRIQLNQFLRPIYKVRLSQNYLPVLMPLLWLDEGIELNDAMIMLLNETIYNMLEQSTPDTPEESTPDTPEESTPDTSEESTPDTTEKPDPNCAPQKFYC